jgi:cation transport ATPase
MAFHLLRTSQVAKDLAAGGVSPREQAGYLVISFLAWTLPFYLYLIPSPLADDPVFLGWMWLIEFVLVVAIFVTGVNYCLRKCRVDARANFLIDFSCLYAPVALTTSIVIWGAFHLLTTLPAWMVARAGSGHETLRALPWLSSAYAYDVLRLLFYVAAIVVIFWRVGEHMERLSGMRQSAPARRVNR